MIRQCGFIWLLFFLLIPGKQPSVPVSPATDATGVNAHAEANVLAQAWLHWPASTDSFADDMPTAWGKVLKKSTKKLKRKFHAGSAFFLAVVGPSFGAQTDAFSPSLSSNPNFTCPLYLLHCSWLI
jgi:hypothetical protein